MALEVGAGQAADVGRAAARGRLRRGRRASRDLAGRRARGRRAAVSPTRPPSRRAWRPAAWRCSPPTRSTGSPATPGDAAAVRRLYALKGRPPRQARGGDVLRPRARARGVARARAAHARGARAAPARRRDAAAAQPAAALPARLRPRSRSLGLRVPALPALAAVRRPVLQSSANRAGGADARGLARCPGDPRRRRPGARRRPLAGHPVDRRSTCAASRLAGDWRCCARGAVAPRRSPPPSVPLGSLRSPMESRP